MNISLSLTELELEEIDKLREETGETRSAFMVRKSCGPDRPPSKRQLIAIAKRARDAILED